MKILCGLKNGAVLQRNLDNLCVCTFFAEALGEIRSSMGSVHSLGDNKYELVGIGVGGPYEITLSDDDGELTLCDLYVGDVWLLAGQSNMEGAGRMTPEDDAYIADARLRAFYMNDSWDAARPMLHQLYESDDPAHKRSWQSNLDSLRERDLVIYDNPPYPQRRGVGPGLYFAKEMYRLTEGVPQGLIATAVGGAPIEMWLPNGEENYYTAAVRRIAACGGNIRGVFWAQGEGNPNHEIYPSQIESIRRDLCQKTGKSEIPFVQMQSFRCTVCIGDASADATWSRFRQMQWTMPEGTSTLATVATNDLELDDCIHLSSDAQKIAGCRAARAMHYLLTGEGAPEPTLDSVYTTKNPYVPALFSEIHLKYKNVTGVLSSSGVPFGFTIRRKDADTAPSMKNVQRIVVEGDEVVLRVEIPEQELSSYEVWYGYGNDFYCNITDGADRAIPSMGPIGIGEPSHKERTDR